MPLALLCPKPPLLAPEDLPLHDLLAAVSGSGKARELVLRHGVPDLAGRSEAELRADGLPPGAARRLAMAFELGRRARMRRLEKGMPLRSPGEVFEAFRARLGDLRVEQFHAILLDAKSRVLRTVLISQGTLTGSLVHPRELFRVAIREAAASVVCVHNHPSGDPEPSPEDRDLTRRLVAAGDLVGVPVRDHVVVGAEGYVSFSDRGWIAR
jgi:DNA repair protein RadC